MLKAIDTLPIDFRMVVILADLQEFSYREIADILDVPVGTVMRALPWPSAARGGVAQARRGGGCPPST